jgi:hypothetical protein
MATKPITMEPTGLTLAEAQATLDAAAQEVARLRATASGRGVERWVERTSRHVYPGPTGARAERDVVEQVLVTDAVDPLTQTRARRALPEAEGRLLDAEAQLQAAQQHAAVAARVAHEATMREGEQLLRAELPGLLKDLRRQQRQWHALQAKLEVLDAQLGRPLLTEWSWNPVMAPGGMLDGFLANVQTRFGIDA